MSENAVDCPVDNFVAKLIHEGILTAYALRQKLIVQRNSRKCSKRVDSNIHHSGKIV